MRPLFGFRLRPLPDLLERWSAGRADRGQYLRGWYWLTDGWYWLGTPAGEVPTTHPAFNAAFGLSPDPEPYLDYLAARFWIDLNEMLPRVLEPVPGELAAVLAAGAWEEWRTQVSVWWHALPEEHELAAWDLWFTATGWDNARVLDLGYLAAPPLLRFWREGETVTVSWDTREQRLDGHLCWAETEGQATLSAAEVQAELEDFRARLDAAMKERLGEVAALGCLSEAEVASLHAQHQGTLWPEPPEADPTDWAAVLRAVRQLEAGSGLFLFSP